MKSLRLKLHQNLCNYRVGNSFKYVQTYPLPTPSMIRGMIHEIMGLNEYKPFSVSIQGKSEAVITNIQRVYKFDREPKAHPEKPRPYKVLVKNSIKTALHGILFVDLHVNMKLVLHIKFKDNNDSDLEKLLESIQNGIVILGRNEDFALVEEAQIVDLKEFSDDDALTKLPMYVLPEHLKWENGTAYRLPFWYETVNSFEENRIFNYVNVHYVGKDYPLKKEAVLQDEENNIVCFLDSPEKISNNNKGE